MIAASARRLRLATLSADDIAAGVDRVALEGGSISGSAKIGVTTFEWLGGAISAGVSSANSSVNPASMERGVRDALRDRESSEDGRTDNGGGGSDGVRISGSWSPAGEKSGNDSTGEGVP